MEEWSTLEICFILLFAGFVCGCIGAVLGDKKNRGMAGFWLGFLLGPIGVLVLVLLPAEAATTTIKPGLRPITTSARHERKCPFCAETILSEAVICRFCQRDLPPVPARDLDPIFRNSGA
jgi:hypothetical protein